MNSDRSDQSATKGRVVAANADVSTLEITFLMTATVIMLATVELIVGLHLR
jgi:hypothetical protein